MGGSIITRSWMLGSGVGRTKAHVQRLLVSTQLSSDPCFPRNLKVDQLGVWVRGGSHNDTNHVQLSSQAFFRSEFWGGSSITCSGQG